ncbi:glycosylphosphatidylinositol-anchored merozoite surface protein [Babesia divergens]|uniref:Glycosylphosphatidylinositol-anchored merozoite surface protein n=1 Tax=Babesia divergens TaxID=32595 RepID=A0AAD9GFF1_BABDI|nr:glycosylphosphatidylinositol-anchored merozoite surface protein [Babesia divergens]
MKFLGILRASALCLLVSALQGKPVSCGFFKNLLSSKKPSSDVSQAPGESCVDAGQHSKKGCTVQDEELQKKLKAMDAEQEERLKKIQDQRKAEEEEMMTKIAEQRKEVVKRLLGSDAPFYLEDMEIFYDVLDRGADVNPEAVQQIGEKIHAYLGSLGIHGDDVKSSLENLMVKIHETVMGLMYGPTDGYDLNPVETTAKPQDHAEASGDSDVEAQKKAEEE